MDQWQSYSNAPGAPRRFNSNPQPGQPQQAREYASAAQSQPPAGYTYEQYQGGLNSHPQSMATSPALPPQIRDGNGDVAMQDAGDPYSGVKYPMRPHHQQHLSASSRGGLHSPQEQSSAAQRYSPMEALSPVTPYTASPQTNQNPYAAARQSPTRPGAYTSPNSYYSTRQQPSQLPPITPFASNSEVYPPSATAQLNAVFGNDPKSPRRPLPQSAQGAPGRGPVPEFTKIRSVSDLQPKINAQPAFRRANPEGGFISVSPQLAPCKQS
jgi:dual specificity protein kinase YAK1